jgi:integrase
MTNGKRFSPLDPNEAKKLEETAEDYDDFLASLTVRALLLLGLRSKEFTHTISEWIVRRGGRLVFHLQPYNKVRGMGDGTCIQGTGKIGQGNPDGKNLYKRGEPCASCRATKGDDVYLSKSSNAERDWVLNTSPELMQLGEDFEWWFKNNKRIPFLGDGVRRRVREVAEEAGIGESRGYKEINGQEVVDINPYDLRHTYGTRLARMEWTPYEIKEQMGHGDLEMPSTYISYAGIRKEELMNEKWDSTQY